MNVPLLFAGQAQKEFTVNEAHVLADALLHAACEGTATIPPAAPADGETWIVGEDAEGAWTGEEGKLAAWQAGTWLFLAPRDGMRLFDASSGQILLYRDGWQRPAAPDLPTGGTTVDAEVRAALSGLIAALLEAGIRAED
ncbi:DUF2793 domain-containing protein [Tsuneonella sp. HG222]